MRITSKSSTAARTVAREFSLGIGLALLAALALSPVAARAGSQTSAEDRRAFDSSFYFGLGIDSFAASELQKYLNPESSNRKLERGVGGFDFAYRLMGQSGQDHQLWVYGETVHGVRSADLDLSSMDSLAAFRLTGVANPGERTLYILRNATSLEAFAGLRWEFHQIRRNDASAVATVYAFGQYGLLTVAGGGGDVLDIAAYGLGVRCIGGRLNGSSLEVGGGRSDFFVEHPDRRLKVSGVLEWTNDLMEQRGMSMFTELHVDSDVGRGSDSVQSYLGFAFDLENFFKPR